MTLTNGIKTRIIRAMRMRAIKNVELAKATGMGRSWVTKLLQPIEDDQSLKSLTDTQVEDIERVLGIQLLTLTETGAITGSMKKLSILCTDNAALSALLDYLAIVAENPIDAIPWVEAKDMSGIGQEIVRISSINEDKPGKVAKLVIQRLQEYADEKTDRAVKQSSMVSAR